VIEIICDGCGRREQVKRFAKPWEWFSREDEDGVQLACDRRCIESTAKASGKTGTVLPI
jgi:hypothetical protein